jgi:hypothetical protein
VNHSHNFTSFTNSLLLPFSSLSLSSIYVLFYALLCSSHLFSFLFSFSTALPFPILLHLRIPRPFLDLSLTPPLNPSSLFSSILFPPPFSRQTACSQCSTDCFPRTAQRTPAPSPLRPLSVLRKRGLDSPPLC